MSIKEFSLALSVGAALVAAPTAASTLHEIDGNFSSDWTSPTVVGNGTTSVSGSGAAGWLGGDGPDIFQFSGLVPGATSIIFDFSLTGAEARSAYENAGGDIYYSFVPFTGSYYVDPGNGKVLGSHDLRAGSFGVVYNSWAPNDPAARGTSRFTLELGEAFAGDLFLALDFTYGRASYNITSPAFAAAPDSGPAPSHVPLPAAGLMLLAGVSGLAFVAMRRRHG